MEERFLRRIDEHMARGNEYMARGNELMAEVREEMRLSREQHSDLRRFVHDQNLRAERVADRQVTALNESVATMHEMRREISVNIADLRDESRAQREALLRLIDRLDEHD